jgi:large subunit ribosomal protein L10
MIKEYKKEKVKALRKTLGEHKNMVFANYQGMTVGEVQNLKKQLRDAHAEYRVVKNSYFKIALKEQGFKDFDDKIFHNPLAVVLLSEKSDVSKALKAMLAFNKATSKLAIKSSLIDDRVYEGKELVALSELPSREVLISRVIGAMKAPLSRLHGVLNGQITKLALVLNQIVEQKGKQPQ